MDIKWQQSVESNPQIFETVLSLQAFAKEKVGVKCVRNTFDNTRFDID